MNVKYILTYLNIGFWPHFKTSNAVYILAFKTTENLKIWAWSDYCYCTSHHWCYLITDVNDTIMPQLPNEFTKLLNISLKLLNNLV